MAWSTESRHTRGYGAAWVRLRETIIQRDFGLCQACKREGRLNPYRKGQGFAVDHIVPKAAGGTDEPGNLELKCGPCHSAKTEREAADAQGRTIKPTIGLDGWPTG
jgi:5-methylcytosine-specific restriction protein A